MIPWLSGISVTMLITGLLLRVVERHAAALGLVDVPNERSSHTQPTPRGGGIAIVVGSVIGLLVVLAMTSSEVAATVPVLLAAAGLVALVSLLDDLRSLPPLVRLGVHAIAAIAVVSQLSLRPLVELPGIGPVPTGGATSVLAVLWVVAVVNIYNFMDGIDGLAGGLALVAGTSWGGFGLATGDRFIAAAGFAIAASSAIFLSRNWAPARVFMGDAGSAFLGFMFALLPLMAAGVGPGARAWPLGVLVLWPFLFDATLTLARRIARGENVIRAHRSHLYQRLVIGGASHEWVSRVYLGLAITSSLAGLAWALGKMPGWAVLGVAGLEATAMILLVRRRNGQH